MRYKSMCTNIIKKKKVNEEINYKYKCEECGINFGYSLGDMELHKLTVHLQKGDVEIK
jgi:rRNA maturation endonuclease Nob1